MMVISVLIVVDCAGAAATGNLAGNVYMADTLKFLGSWNEGQCDLHTLTQTGQLIKWRVVPVSPDSQVSIMGFGGQMLDQRVCVPQKTGIDDDLWEGRVEAKPGRYNYDVQISVSGKSMRFSPWLEVE
ncbi:hypothetical protein JMG10_07930 [Nostoc ellipsosporum NOK]|nr:hypothetical protein [Nostoc ellipsosporum NOK]